MICALATALYQILESQELQERLGYSLEFSVAPEAA